LPTQTVGRDFFGNGGRSPKIIVDIAVGLGDAGAAQGVVKVVCRQRLPGALQKRPVLVTGHRLGAGQGMFCPPHATFDTTFDDVTSDGMVL
jgi:hypothetical protein